MANKWVIVSVAIVGTLVGFLLESAGPVGKMIWPVAEGLPEPGTGSLVALMLMGLIEAMAFGVGIAFLVFGYPLVQRVTVRRGPTLAAFFATAWVLINWVPHTAMHMSHGNINDASDYASLAGIEYGFHFTLIIAGSILALFLLRAVQMMSQAPAPRSAKAPAPASKPSG